jgi:hypothetical protein
MKERIRELAKQAGGHGLKMSTMGLSLLGEDAIEKFAQLIVKECADQFKLVYTDEHYQRRIDKTILKHFGFYE